MLNGKLGRQLLICTFVAGLNIGCLAPQNVTALSSQEQDSSSAQDTPSESVSANDAATLTAILTASLRPQSPATVALYHTWQSRFIQQAPCAADELYIGTFGNSGEAGDITVSEAQGYGLLLCAMMASHDPNSHVNFDRILTFVQRRNISSGLPLMAARINSSCQAVGGITSATDAELDIAFALLLAEHIWGNSGAIAYGDVARTRVAAIMKHIVQNPNSSFPTLGLWENIAQGDTYFGGAKMSAIMPVHLRAFAAATHDVRWQTILSNGFAAMLSQQAHSAYGLLPDLSVYSAGGESVLPASPNYLSAPTDGIFYYNACRIPLRLGVDALIDATSPGQQILIPLVTGLLRLSANNPNTPNTLMDGYALDGTVVGTNGNSVAFTGPLAAGWVGLNPNSANTNFFVSTLVSGYTANEVYYSAALRVLAAVSMGI